MAELAPKLQRSVSSRLAECATEPHGISLARRPLAVKRIDSHPLHQSTTTLLCLHSPRTSYAPHCRDPYPRYWFCSHSSTAAITRFQDFFGSRLCVLQVQRGVSQVPNCRFDGHTRDFERWVPDSLSRQSPSVAATD
jgi:hypothetical protein